MIIEAWPIILDVCFFRRVVVWNSILGDCHIWRHPLQARVPTQSLHGVDQGNLLRGTLYDRVGKVKSE